MIGEGTGVTLGLLATIAGVAITLWVRIDAKFSEAAESRKKIADDLADYKLDAERRFASSTMLEKTENRLIVAVEKLSARVETLISRMESLGQEFAKLASRDE